MIGPPAWGLGERLTTHCKIVTSYEMKHKALDLDSFFWNDVSNGKWT
jgi:hypothetical protein